MENNFVEIICLLWLLLMFIGVILNWVGKARAYKFYNINKCYIIMTPDQPHSQLPNNDSTHVVDNKGYWISRSCGCIRCLAGDPCESPQLFQTGIEKGLLGRIKI